MHLHGPRHLTYCLNVHPGEGWAENLDAIRNYVLPVRQRVAPGKPFGLGLRIAHKAACELSESAQLREQAKAFFDENGLYAFTINGFPYGKFHQGRVKENVYAPDWRTVERRDYTSQLASILAEWVPENTSGSISTVPCSFKPWIKGDEDKALMARRLVECAEHLQKIRSETGRLIHIGLEPEPSCFLETTREAIEFFERWLLPAGDEAMLRWHIGVCLDTCHVALQFEELAGAVRAYQSAGILISKVQLSAALAAKTGAQAFRDLRAFCEPVYFHQVKARQLNGEMLSWHDLSDALEQQQRMDGELRVHYHVPLFFEGNASLQSTSLSMDGEFWSLLKSATEHLEIETYTFDVLPPELRAGGIVQSIADEFAWVLGRV